MPRLVNTLKKQRSVFTKQSIMQDAATEASFMVSYKLAKGTSRFQMVSLSRDACLT